MKRHQKHSYNSRPCPWGLVTLAAVFGIQLLHPTPTLAQKGVTLDEIIVTANKKDEMLKDVASTVNVVTAAMADEFVVLDFQEVQGLTPGLTLTRIDPRTFFISLRGAPYNPNSGASETVVTYWNGMPIRSNVTFNQLYDIERIEILRGPQGTLQGQTSPSGSIQIYTKQGNPDVFEGQLNQTYDQSGASTIQFGVSVPVVDGKLGVRVAGVYADDDQFGLSSTTTGKSASSRTSSTRISTQWLPNDDLQISLTAEYLERSTDGLQIVEGQDMLDGNDPTLTAFDRKSLQEGPSDIELINRLINLSVDYVFADYTISAISGYQNNLNYTHRDLDLGNIFALTSRDQLVESRAETFTQELRVANNDARFWEYLVGLYYNKRQSSGSTNNVSFNGFSYDRTKRLSIPATGSPLIYGDPNLLVAATSSTSLVNDETIGAFVDNKLLLTDQLSLQIGARYQEKKMSQSINNVLTADYRAPSPVALPPAVISTPAGTAVTSGLGIPPSRGDNTYTATTGSVKLSYALNEYTIIYSSYDRSYRPGGITVAASSGLRDTSLLLYDQETSDSVEVGYKSILGNGRYHVNGAIFYQQFDNFINLATNIFIANGANANVLNELLLGGINYNADAIISGAELEGTALINENWIVFAGISYTSSRFDNARIPCGNPGDLADPGAQIKTCLSNGRLGSEPLWSASSFTEYTIPEIFFGAEGYVRALYQFTDNRADDFASVNNNLYGKYALGAYAVTNLYIGIRAEDETWDVSFWVKNLFDKQARTNIGVQEVQGGLNFGIMPFQPDLLQSGYSTVSVIAPQTLGITGRYRFGGL